MILQTGQRTDIPAFYGQWLINRVRQGFVDVRNPYNPIQITRYPINHEVVDGIAFFCFMKGQDNDFTDGTAYGYSCLLWAMVN